MGTSCAKVVPIPSSSVIVDLSSCVADRGAALYGLKSFRVTLTSTVTESIVNSTITFDNPASAEMRVIYGRALGTMVIQNVSLPSNAKRVDYYRSDSDLPFTAYAIFAPVVEDRHVLPIQFLFDYASKPGEIVVYARFYEHFAFSVSAPSGTPIITATIIPTHDGKEINELLFQVASSEGVSNYRQPVVRFAPVICGCASSLRQKILDLGEGEKFLQYLVFRYILSGIAYVKRFDVCLLRRRYNLSFLASLVGTEYEGFLPILEEDPRFAHYFLC